MRFLERCNSPAVLERVYKALLYLGTFALLAALLLEFRSVGGIHGR